MWTFSVQKKYVSSLTSLSLIFSSCLDALTDKELQFSAEKLDSVIEWMNKFSKKADSYAQSIREHGMLISDIHMHARLKD